MIKSDEKTADACIDDAIDRVKQRCKTRAGRPTSDDRPKKSKKKVIHVIVKLDFM